MIDTNIQGEEPYVVTRGKPPREYQFKKGQSGNPRGRPKGSKQISALLEEELDRKLDVTVHGRRMKLSKRQVMVKQLVERALKGDHKAIATCLAMQAKGGSLPQLARRSDFRARSNASTRVMRVYRQKHRGYSTSSAK